MNTAPGWTDTAIIRVDRNDSKYNSRPDRDQIGRVPPPDDTCHRPLSTAGNGRT
jgi:hypothetical protein